MKRRELERRLEHLTKAVPAAIREAGIKPNSCILSTRLGVEALRAYGVRARPLPVKLTVYNAVTWEHIEAGEEDLDKWRGAGGWIVMLGRGSDSKTPGGWDGHLVVMAAERYLVDLSAGQVQRLHRGIKAEAFWAEARELARDRPGGLRGEDGCVWVYEPDRENRSYLSRPAWSAYRVARRDGRVVSERSGPAVDVPVAPRVTVPL